MGDGVAQPLLAGVRPEIEAQRPEKDRVQPLPGEPAVGEKAVQARGEEREREKLWSNP